MPPPMPPQPVAPKPVWMSNSTVLTGSRAPINETVALSVRALPVALALAHLVPPLARAFAGLVVETTMGSVEGTTMTRAPL
eukprot:SAG31_NODE_16665_length_700_cov_6.928453_1_plen_81_part_00